MNIIEYKIDNNNQIYFFSLIIPKAIPKAIPKMAAKNIRQLGSHHWEEGYQELMSSSNDNIIVSYTITGWVYSLHRIDSTILKNIYKLNNIPDNIPDNLLKYVMNHNQYLKSSEIYI